MIGIQAATFSNAIHAGNLNKAQTMFTKTPQDVTMQALGAVAKYVETHFDGGARIEIGGYVMEITVEKTEGDQA